MRKCIMVNSKITLHSIATMAIWLSSWRQLLRGEIDLLWYTEDGVVLVDYKNIQGEEANPEHYASQMEAYREVVESAGHKCKGIILFYATLGQIIELK